MADKGFEEFLTQINGTELRQIVETQMGLRISRAPSNEELIALLEGAAVEPDSLDPLRRTRENLQQWISENMVYFSGQLTCNGDCSELSCMCTDIQVLKCALENDQRIG